MGMLKLILGIVFAVYVLLLGLAIMWARCPKVRRFLNAIMGRIFLPIMSIRKKHSGSTTNVWRKHPIIGGIVLVCAIVIGVILLHYPKMEFVYLHYFIVNLWNPNIRLARNFPIVYGGGLIIYAGLIFLTFKEKRKNLRQVLICFDIIILIVIGIVSLVAYYSFTLTDSNLINVRSEAECLKMNKPDDCCDWHKEEFYWNGSFCRKGPRASRCFCNQ